MAATGIGNPVGAVPIFDGGNPRIITGYAQTLISGGCLVYAAGTADSLSSGADSFAATDLEWANDASGLLFNGICMQTTASGAPCPVATRGAFILVANGTVTAGYPVKADGNNSVANAAVSTDANDSIGRALCGATSGNYCLIDIWG